jgi:hypothetical protein
MPLTTGDPVAGSQAGRSAPEKAIAFRLDKTIALPGIANEYIYAVARVPRGEKSLIPVLDGQGLVDRHFQAVRTKRVNV